MKFVEIKKSFNEALPKAVVKVEGLDGTFRPFRDSAGKTYRLIPTYVTYNGDGDPAKYEKVAEKFNEIINKLKSLGGIVVTKSGNHAIVDFVKPKKNMSDPDKGHRAHIFKEKFKASQIGDKGYQIFFSVEFESL